MSDYNQEEQNSNPDAPAEGGQRPAGNNMSMDTRYIRSLEGIVKLVAVVSYTYPYQVPPFPWRVAWLINNHGTSISARTFI